MTTHTRSDDVRDALAWTEALIAGDVEAMAAIARGCDAGGMLDGLGALYAGLIVSTQADPSGYFARVRARVADMDTDTDSPPDRAA